MPLGQGKDWARARTRAGGDSSAMKRREEVPGGESLEILVVRGRLKMRKETETREKRGGKMNQNRVISLERTGHLEQFLL